MNKYVNTESHKRMPYPDQLGCEITRELEEKFRQHKRSFPQYYFPTYKEANFTHKALCKGFTTINDDFDPYNNWFGVSLYSPDVNLVRENKRIVLSLQGFLMRIPKPEENIQGWHEVSKQRSLKYLAFMDDNDIKYETFFGNLPDEEFIEQFIK